ncbi:unnamed protein product [Prunus armeniaca]
MVIFFEPLRLVESREAWSRACFGAGLHELASWCCSSSGLGAGPRVRRTWSHDFVEPCAHGLGFSMLVVVKLLGLGRGQLTLEKRLWDFQPLCVADGTKLHVVG